MFLFLNDMESIFLHCLFFYFFNSPPFFVLIIKASPSEHRNSIPPLSIYLLWIPPPLHVHAVCLFSAVATPSSSVPPSCHHDPTLFCFLGKGIGDKGEVENGGLELIIIAKICSKTLWERHRETVLYIFSMFKKSVLVHVSCNSVHICYINLKKVWIHYSL